MKIKVIDNFLENKDFSMFKNLKLPEVDSNKIKIFHNKIDRDNKCFTECLSDQTLKNLQNNYHPKALKILEELYPEKIKLYNFSEFHVVLTGSKYKFPIHDDTPNKLLSGVIYINPEKNKGTMFCDDKKGFNSKNVDWKQNRAVFFARKERETWHSFESDGISTRVAVVYNLMTTDIKSVCKIEGKNFILSSLRYKLNPYIYRYFKKVF